MIREIAQMRFFLADTRLNLALSVKERHLLGQGLGKWPPQDATDASWSGENLLAVIWTLNRAELPPIWETRNGVSDFAIDDPFLWESWIAEATLRLGEETERMSGYLEAVRLRGRTPDGYEGIPWLADKAKGLGGVRPSTAICPSRSTRSML